MQKWFKPFQKFLNYIFKSRGHYPWLYGAKFRLERYKWFLFKFWVGIRLWRLPKCKCILFLVFQTILLRNSLHTSVSILRVQSNKLWEYIPISYDKPKQARYRLFPSLKKFSLSLYSRFMPPTLCPKQPLKCSYRFLAL